MKLQTMSRPLCSVYSLAMATDTPVEQVLDLLNMHEDLGIHICELQIAALKLGYAGVLLSNECELEVHTYTRMVSIPFYEMSMNHNRSLLFTGLHAYACDGHKVYDPRGFIHDLRIDWLKSNIHLALLLYPIQESNHN